MTNCDALGNTFTVNVENDSGSTDDIIQVEIYKALAGISGFTCGAAPTGWTLFSFTDRCIYVTGLASSDKIAPNQNLNYTFDATMSSSACESKFVIATVDDEGTQGDRDTTVKAVKIDCTPPVIKKTVGNPKIAGTGFDWWITQSTQIDVDAYDNNTTDGTTLRPANDRCDLGLDYCQWRYKVDGGSWSSWDQHSNGGNISFNFDFDEDSIHDIEIECYDIVKNKTVITETDKVDDTPPVTTKVISNPKKVIPGDDPNEFIEWVDTATEITLTSVDPDPTGYACNIGVVELYWSNEIVPDQECWDPANYCTPNAEPNYTKVTGNQAVIKKSQESCHKLQYYAVDELGNRETVQTNCFFVDKTPPMVFKDNGNAIPDSGEPAFTNPGNQAGDFHWITQNMPVTFTCDDGVDVTGRTVPHPSGDEQVCYKVSYDYVPDPTGIGYGWGYITNQYCSGSLTYDGYCCTPATPKAPYDFYFKEDSMHNLEYYCKDAVDKNGTVHTQYYKVDTRAPDVNKTLNPPYFGDCPPVSGTNDVCFVDTATTIDLQIKDEGTCAVDQVVCEWRYNVDGGQFTSWTSRMPISFPQESKHQLEIKCSDALGNTWTDTEYFYVDKTPPTTTKTYVGPQWPDPITSNTPYPHWVDTITEVELTATDNIGPHDSGVKETMYSVTQVADRFCDDQYECETNAQGSGNFVPYAGMFTLPESCQLIEYYSVDNVGKTEIVNKQCVYSDHTPPVAYLESIVGPSIDCSRDPTMCTVGQDYWVADHVSTVNLGCMDGPNEPHPAPLDKIYWRIDIDGTGFGPWQQADARRGAAVVFTEDSVHTVEYYCTDKVQKTSSTETIVFRVDSTPPQIIKTVGDPWIDCPLQPIAPNGTSNGPMECYQIDGVTEITVDAVDPDPTGFGCAVDKVTCEWGYLWLGQYYGPFTEQALPFTISGLDESEHILDITCRDALGNEVTDVEKFIVDKTPPETYKQYTGPQFSDGPPEYSFQTYSRDIEGSAETLEVTVEDDGTWIIWNFDFPVETFTGNGNLNVGLIIALDGEGQGPAFQIHNNDGTDPNYSWGTWLYSPWGPTIGDGWFGWHSGSDNNLVTSLSWVEATGNRNAPHGNGGNGVMEIKIKKSQLGESFHWAASPTVGSGFSGVYDVTMQIPTAFGWSTPLVDMSVPNYEYAQSVKGEYPKWINSSTMISMSATDDIGPHDSGVAETKYRVSLVADGYCDADTTVEDCDNAVGTGSWMDYSVSFNIPQQSCHLIEYYSVDDVNKTETVKKQCVYVDNSAPDPVKTVGEPNTKWYPSSDPFSEDYVTTKKYQYLVDACWNTDPAKSIDCWKVTLQTPIDLGCVDPQPHPVDHETVCFQVELDGVDATQNYCTSYGGVMNQQDGFCCMQQSLSQFYFQEETEHNLQYYCVDALDNKGPIDDEKFKVGGRKFEIQLNKKWNLISVPYSLIDANIGEVLKDVKDNVNAVWTYDPLDDLCPTEWCVYRPTDPSTSNLDTMDQGWGYWVAAYDDDTLVIGGSKFKPGPVGQASRNLVKGWNLVGYYGADDGADPPTYTYSYNGPNGNGKEAGCSLYSLGSTVWDKGPTSLITYWEPDNTNQWKQIGKLDNMDPGAGYWLGTPGEGYIYYYTDCQGWVP
jgi:hypothetical protein